MFIVDFDVEEVKGETSKVLKKLGIKYRFKKIELKTVSCYYTFYACCKDVIVKQ